MNKKYYLFGFMFMFSVLLVSAALVTYYGSIEQEMIIDSPISVDSSPESITGFGGGSYIGSEIVIEGLAPFDVPVTIFNDAPEGVDVEYRGSVNLSLKSVDFGATNWNVVGEPITVTYTVVGDEFTASVVNPIEGYVLVYYKDQSDRFNSPSEAIPLSEVSEVLPYASDANAGEHDYCAEEEEYNTCHGAKLWYVPSAALNGNEINWSQASDIYFELDLVQYARNGEIVVYSGSIVVLNPLYTVSPTYTGTQPIITEVQPTE